MSEDQAEQAAPKRPRLLEQVRERLKPGGQESG